MWYNNLFYSSSYSSKYYMCTYTYYQSALALAMLYLLYRHNNSHWKQQIFVGFSIAERNSRNFYLNTYVYLWIRCLTLL